MEKALGTLELYFNGSTTDGEVAQAWDCFGGAFGLFLKHVRGVHSDYYTAYELRGFLEKYFLGNIRISDRLLIEAMRLKQVVLGGAIDRVTREELAETDRLIQVFKAETIKLRPHIQVLALGLPRDDVKKSPEKAVEAIRQLRASADVIGKRLAGSASPYQLRDADALLQEFGALYQTQGEPWDGPEWLRHHLSTIAALKGFFIRPNGDAIAPSEWHELLVGASRLFGLYLRYDYMLSDAAVSRGPGLEQLGIALDDLFDLLDSSVRAKADQVIGYPEIDNLITEIFRLEFVDLGMTEPTMKQLVRPVLEKVYNPSVGGNRAKAGGITLPALEMMRQDFRGWSEMQSYWDRAEAVVVSKGLPAEMTMPEFRQAWSGSQATNKSAGDEITYLLHQSHPLTYTSEGSVVFEPDITKLRMDSEAFASLNWKRLFISVVVRGYAADAPSARFSGLTKREFKAFYEDLKNYGVELGFLDPTSIDMWDSTFDEANMFLLSSDGDELLSFAEGVELLSYALSAGVVNRKVYADLRTNCKNYEPDVFGLPKLDLACYRTRFREQFVNYYYPLPHWVNLAKGLSKKQWQELQESIEKVARRNGYSNDLMESSDTDRTGAVLQYIESLFVRFDRDQDGFLDLEESRPAYQILKPTLARLSGMDDEEWLFPIFTYLMNKGKKPSTDVLGKVEMWWWKEHPDMWPFKADRRQLMKIIGNLRASGA